MNYHISCTRHELLLELASGSWIAILKKLSDVANKYTLIVQSLMALMENINVLLLNKICAKSSVYNSAKLSMPLKYLGFSL